MKKLSVAALFCFVQVLFGAKPVDDTPSWLKEAASTKIPNYEAKVPAVVLLDEKRISMDASGKIVSTVHRAIRILTREGRDEAVAEAGYLRDTGKAKELRAWLIMPDGQTKRYGKEKVVEITPGREELYNDYRVKLIVADSDANPGTVFGFEATGEDRSVFTQFDWDFQDRNPCLRSRFSLALPAGWRADAVTFNHAAVAPMISSGEYSWELKDLPYIEREPASPRYAALVPRLAVSVFPSKADTVLGPSFSTWGEVSQWLSHLSEKQREPSPTLAAKAAELTANAKTGYERIQAIGSYVQALKYVAIEIGLGRGGGYKPHEARQVFDRQYGDCKDKANLMVAMLKVAGIPAYMVSIYSGDRTYVREEWASPQQFNHAIVAVTVSDTIHSPAVVQHPTLGALLIFDATDPYTRVGDLPEHEQGSLALIEAGDAGALIRMPAVQPGASRVERQTEVTLAADGAIAGTVHENGIGQSGAAARARFHTLEPADYTKSIERWLASTVNGATISDVKSSDGEGSFNLEMKFSAPRYAQVMQGRLMVVKPDVISRRDATNFTEPTRKYPIVLNAQSFQETVKIALPKEFKVDELPDGGTLEAKFGTYTSKYEMKDGYLWFTRTLEVSPMTLPPERYAEVREFFGHVRAAEQAPVVLIKN